MPRQAESAVRSDVPNVKAGVRHIPNPCRFPEILPTPGLQPKAAFSPRPSRTKSGPSSSSLRPDPKRTCPGRRQDPAIHTSSASFTTKDGSFRMLYLGVTETETKEENHDLHVRGPTQMRLGPFHTPLGLHERNREVHTPWNLLCRTLRLGDSSRHPKKLNAPKVFDPGQASTATTPRPSAATKAASQRVKREREEERERALRRSCSWQGPGPQT